MEFILRFVVLPVSLIASIAFCLFMRGALLRWPRLSPVCWRASLIGLGPVATCAAMIFWPGPSYLVKHFDLPYTLFYQLCFLSAPVVITTPLIVTAVRKNKGWLASFIGPSIVCFCVCAFLLFADIFIYEAAFGPS